MKTAVTNIFIQKAKKSIATQLLITIILIVSLVYLFSNFYVIYNNYQIQFRNIEHNSQNIGNLVVAGILEKYYSPHDNQENLEDLKKSALVSFKTALQLDKNNNSNIAYIYLFDKNKNFLTGEYQQQILNIQKQPQNLDNLNTIVKENKNLYAYNLKITNRSLHNEHLGFLSVGVSLKNIHSELKQSLLVTSLLLFALLGLLVLYLRWALKRLVISPLARLNNAFNALKEGDYKQRLPVQGETELAEISNGFNLMTEGLLEREKLKDAFNRYVSPRIYELYKSKKIGFEGENRIATILFADIRSFTTISENHKPQEVVQLLNEYFQTMVNVIHAQDGFVNKFIGDAIMAVYNVPGNQEDHPYRAVQTGFSMLNTLNVLNDLRIHRGEVPIKIGIGINTGEVIAGNIGHPERMEYTVIGDSVNIAQRIEGQTKIVQKHLLISETTYMLVKDKIIAEELKPVSLKGKSHPLRLYAVKSLRV